MYSLIWLSSWCVEWSQIFFYHSFHTFWCCDCPTSIAHSILAVIECCFICGSVKQSRKSRQGPGRLLMFCIFISSCSYGICTNQATVACCVLQLAYYFGGTRLPL